MIGDAEQRRYDELRAIVAKLRAPDGCPWDREQTHASLRPYVIEEAYEVLAALDDADLPKLREELGDLLFQVLIHTQLAEEAGEFTMGDVLQGLADKPVRRHPHVFGDTRLEGSGQVVAQWDELKKAERAAAAESALAGIPPAQPALSLAQALLRRAASAGFAWPRREDVLAKLTEELDELARARTKEEAQEEFGDILFNLANYARYLEIDAEEALRGASRKFRARFNAVEQQAQERERPLTELSRDELMRLWDEAKRGEQ
mgnify:CR=1 FL=1